MGPVSSGSTKRPGKQTATVEVAAGETVTRDFDLVSSLDAATDPGAPIQLADFVVSSEREGNAKAIMEQRNSVNMTNTVSSDYFGDVAEGNVGEFLKTGLKRSGPLTAPSAVLTGLAHELHHSGPREHDWTVTQTGGRDFADLGSYANPRVFDEEKFADHEIFQGPTASGRNLQQVCVTPAQAGSSSRVAGFGLTPSDRRLRPLPLRPLAGNG